MLHSHGKGVYPDILGVVLAGGLSSRMGQDKISLDYGFAGYADLLQRTATCVASVVSDIVIIGRESADYPYLLDDVLGCGPVGGIATALRVAAATDRACLVVSCDLPFMRSSLLHTLLAFRAGQLKDGDPVDYFATAYRQKETGHTEALVAVYERTALPYFQQCIAQRLFKISLAIPKEKQCYLDYSARDSLPFFNINYPADFAVAKLLLEHTNGAIL